MKGNNVSKLKFGSLILLGIVIGSYSLFQGWKIIAGPIIDIYSPQNGSTYSESLIEIEGRAKNVAYINLNDKRIFTDKDGYFKEKLLLSPGYNIIRLDAQDKFRNSTEKRLELILKEY